MFRTLLCALLLALTACASNETDSTAKSYQTRGVIRQIPAANAIGQELIIAHEEIPTFESIDGEIVGMKTMAMGFPVSDPSLLSGLAVGDKIAFTLKVDWDGSPPLEVTELKELPATTILGFEKAASDEATDVPAESDASGHESHQQEDHEGSKHEEHVDHGAEPSVG